MLKYQCMECKPGGCVLEVHYEEPSDHVARPWLCPQEYMTAKWEMIVT